MDFNPSGPVVVLDNLRSVYNVASLYRTLDSLGIFSVICVGTTPTPYDKYGRFRKDFTKVSLGAEKTVQTYHTPTTHEAVTLIKNLGYTLISVEQHPRSQDYKTYQADTKTALVLGAEVDGVSSQFLEASDVILELPQKGLKESLNVSVAGAVVLYRLFDI